MAERVNLYDNVYGDFGGAAEAAVRQETYGEDIGQSSWMTVGEWRRFADHVRVRPESHVLEVGSGSGGPAVYLAATTRCRITGVDINESGVQNGERLASRDEVAGRATFKRVDASQPLPFPDASFNAVISNDAICHLPNRLDVLRDWHRLVGRRGRILFTDALVVTGPLSHEEIATRSSIGFYVFVPPGENERLLEAAGFAVLAVEDVTHSTADISRRRHDARARHERALVEREGQQNFDGLQRYLRCVHSLAAERRLSRFAYLAEKR
jgi:SAM-dependent methyltransferase